MPEPFSLNETGFDLKLAFGSLEVPSRFALGKSCPCASLAGSLRSPS
jgi:hypothetical protein